MRQADAAPVCAYELPLLDGSVPAAPTFRGGEASLPEPILARNVLWFCRLRWVVVAILSAVGILGTMPRLSAAAGLRLRANWPFTTAAILTLANLAFLWHARRLVRGGEPHGARTNLWCQIVLDLLILTTVVHFVGSLETYIPFAYLFHIGLACIFLSRRGSLVVALTASVFYIGCVTAEWRGLLASGGIYADTPLRRDVTSAPTVVVLDVISAIVIWLVVWYLISHLSSMVRERDSRLAEANQRLIAAQAEKARHMLRTTHELKAPFAAIDANTQLLQKGHCGKLSEKAQEVVKRIAERSKRLAAEIQEMLQLANLTSENETALVWVELDLADVLRWCLAQIEPLAQEQGVVIESDLTTMRVFAVNDHMKMLFRNVIENAVLYSHPGGHVHVMGRNDAQGRAEVTVKDRGIGIPPDKLPRIFDEYYHTDEAARHNKRSTGLGLAIVRQVAQTHRIRVRVESHLGVGTTFKLTFPCAARLDFAGVPKKGVTPCPISC